MSPAALSPKDQQPDQPEYKPEQHLPDKGMAQDGSNPRAESRQQAQHKRCHRDGDQRKDDQAQHLMPPYDSVSGSIHIHHLARVHDVLRVDRLLDHPHQRIGIPMLGCHVFLFAKTDAVLSGHCAAKLD